MHFVILTLYPELFPGPLAASITGKALARNEWRITTLNIRDYAQDRA
jgi:tRNA (guanine37-N1)-methyltransferase